MAATSSSPTKVNQRFSRGVIAEGELTWHARSRQWIIGVESADKDADEVGGCSDGPEVVDLVARVYWTC